ncbi:MAG: ABC transporter ATP-binding protein, partial [Campylobacterota bacterium]
MLQVRNLYYSLNNNVILQNISFALQSAQLHMIVGPNGAGKSTLLSAISGLLSYGGQVTLNNEDITNNSFAQNAKMLSLMQQFQQTPPLEVRELLSLGRRPFCGFKLEDEDEKIIQTIIDTLEIAPFLHRDLSSLSGGERQRIYLAKSLIQTPKLLLLDEPISHLDPRAQMDILERVKKVTIDQKLITVVVMHDLQSALHYGDTVLMLKSGKLLHHAKTKEVTQQMFETVFDIECKIFHHEGHPFVHLGHKHAHKPCEKHV